METDLNDVLVFGRVVDSGSFTAAAGALGLPTSTVSRRVSRLEERLGVRLLQRTTRKFSLTDAGRTYYESAARIALELDDADRAVTQMQATPRGALRVAAPIELAPYIWESIQGFLRELPQVQLELAFTDRHVNLVEEGYDVAICGGVEPPSQANIVAHKVGELRVRLVASPAYLKEHGEPRRPQDLREHDCIVYTPWSTNDTWTLRGRSGSLRVPIKARVRVNHMDVVKQAALAGVGIAQVVEVHCAAEIKSGELRVLLSEACQMSDAMWVIHGSRRYLSSVVRAFVDYAAHFWATPDEKRASMSKTRNGHPRSRITGKPRKRC